MHRPLAVLLLLVVASGTAQAQEFVFSIKTDLPGPATIPVADEELLALMPGGGSRVVLPREALNALVGDADGNGFLDDAPVDIDACHIRGPLGGSDWLLSTTTTMNLPGAPPVSDGGVFLWDGSGQVDVLYPESFFEGITGTSGIDVDAFAIGSGGELYFSFAEDETTTVVTLISENGGDPVLDEQTVLRFLPTDNFAHVHLTKSQVVGVFNTAVAGNFSTVVDITGLECDPAGAPGDLLLVCGSASQGLRGRVVSTRSGGVQVQLGGIPLDPNLFGLGSSLSLDALTLSVGPLPPVLRALPDSASASAGGPGSILLSGLVPGDPMQLVVTEPSVSGLVAMPAIAPAGFGAIHVDPLHPMWGLSLAYPGWRMTADITGLAGFTFGFQGLPPNIQVVAQAIRLTDLNLSNPVAISVMP